MVTQGRNLRRVGNIQAGKKVKFVLKPSRPILPHDAEVIRILLNAEAIEINEALRGEERHAHRAHADGRIVSAARRPD